MRIPLCLLCRLADFFDSLSTLSILSAQCLEHFNASASALESSWAAHVWDAASPATWGQARPPASYLHETQPLVSPERA